jgi:hypothetical protein
VCHCSAESYWLARRSVDADLAVWVWIEQQDTPRALGQSAMVSIKRICGLHPT